MVVEYGFGEIMKNTSLVELHDYAFTSGKDVIDDIQRIINTVQEETEHCIARNREVLEKLIAELEQAILLNSERLQQFFKENPVS